jgi:hypothetical protein
MKIWILMVAGLLIGVGVVRGQPGPSPGGGGVTSFNTRSGAVTFQTGDLPAALQALRTNNATALTNFAGGTIQSTNGNGRAVLTIGNQSTTTTGILKLYDGANDKQQSITAADAEMDFATGITGGGNYYFDLGAGVLNGNGSGVTNLNASSLGSGTVPINRLPPNSVTNLNWNNTGLVFEGDSLTSSGNWPSIFTNYLISLGYTIPSATNAAVSGTGITDAIGRFTNSVLPRKLGAGTNNLVSLLIGANDIATMDGPTFYSNALYYVTNCARPNGFKVAMWAITPHSNFGLSSSNRICANYLLSLDTNLDYFIDSSRLLPNTSDTTLYSDQIHQTVPKGVNVLAFAFYAAMSKPPKSWMGWNSMSQPWQIQDGLITLRTEYGQILETVDGSGNVTNIANIQATTANITGAATAQSLLATNTDAANHGVNINLAQKGWVQADLGFAFWGNNIESYDSYAHMAARTVSGRNMGLDSGGLRLGHDASVGLGFSDNNGGGGDVYQSLNTKILPGVSGTLIFHTNGIFKSNVTATNGLTLPQINWIPTNSIPASSTGVTNWVLCNLTNNLSGTAISGGPTYVATNIAAAGSFLLARPTYTLTTFP